MRKRVDKRERERADERERESESRDQMKKGWEKIATVSGSN